MTTAKEIKTINRLIAAAISKLVIPVLKWAKVTSVSPLRIKYPNESPLPITPPALYTPTLNDDVLTVRWAGQTVVLGAKGWNPGGGGGVDPEPEPQLWVTPQDFGALADGANDDAPAIQAAIDSEQPVYIPPGSYRLATLPLRFRQGSWLRLHPEARMIRAATGNLTVNTPGSIGAATAGGYSGVGRIRIEGGIWDFRATEYPSGYNGLLFGHAESIIITGARFIDCPSAHMVELHGCRDVLIQGCFFGGFTDSVGNRPYSEAIQLDVARGGFTPADGTCCYNVTVRDCRFGASGTAGTQPLATGVGSHTATWGYRHRDIHIVNNSFEGCTWWAINAYNWSEAVITGNTIYGAGSSPFGGGIRVRALDLSVASARLDLDGVEHNEGQPQNDVVVQGNTIRNVTEGIRCEGESTSPGEIYSLVVADNIVRGTTGDGISFRYVNRLSGGNNIVSQAGGKRFMFGAGVSNSRSVQPFAALMERSTALSLAANSHTVVAGGTSVFDDDGILNASAGEVTIPETGMYQLTGLGQFADIATATRRILYFQVNSSTRCGQVESVATGRWGANIQVERFCTRDEVIRLVAFATAATSLDGSTSAGPTSFSVRRIP